MQDVIDTAMGVLLLAMMAVCVVGMVCCLIILAKNLLWRFKPGGRW